MELDVYFLDKYQGTMSIEEAKKILVNNRDAYAICDIGSLEDYLDAVNDDFDALETFCAIWNTEVPYTLEECIEDAMHELHELRLWAIETYIWEL